jgi:trimeric autotransporter adhesin
MAPLSKGAVMKRGILQRKRLSLAVAVAFSAGAAHAQSNLPSGAQVTSGTASVSQSSATAMLVTQTTDKAALNWQSFSIGAGHSVQFLQPSASSIALNRVIGGSRSEIYGNLSANGQVFLVNPNGILFGKTAQVDVGGIVASTLDISERDFLDGKYVFSDPANRNSVLNEGALKGRYVALIGHHAINRGTIQAERGAVALGGGSTVQLALADNRLVSFEVQQSALDALAENGGLIQADGGRVILTAGARDSLLASAVNNTGVIEARTVEQQPGNILLLAGMEAGTTRVGGRLDASAPNGGDGGFIETSGANVKVADNARVTTKAANGKSGTWLIDPTNFTIAAGTGAQTSSGIGAATLSTNLADGNVTIETAAGGTEDGDIFVNGAVGWNANTTLTLTAHRDININAVITASGGSALNLNPVTGTIKVGLNTAHTAFTGRVDFFEADGVTARSGTGFLTIKGQGYTVISDVNQLQAMAGDLAGFYALGADINASATSGWNGGAGFAPVGSVGSPFTGVFDGLGHTISAFTINRPSADRVGLFSSASGATLRNVALGGVVNGSVNVGALAGAGSNGTRLHNILSSVTVSGEFSVGGIVGNLQDSTMADVHATGAVVDSGAGDERGGLIGLSTGNVLSRVSALGAVLGNGNMVGGLIGYSENDLITEATAGGDLVGTGNQRGGLIGHALGTTIASSHATGDVSGSGTSIHQRGGLVGEMSGGSITGSDATGDVQGGADIGGLVGRNSATISNSHAIGNVTGTSDRVGGLVGDNTGVLANVRAEGDASGVNRVGGLVGQNIAAINGAVAGRSGGTVTATGDYAGGLVGYNDGGAITGTITTPVLAQSAVTGEKSWVGGAIGYNHRAHLTHVSASGAVSSTGAALPDGEKVGGLVGEHAGGTIDHGTASGPVHGRTRVGGLIGRISQDSPASGALQNNLVDSSASGNVTRAGTAAAGLVGGLVGEVNDVQQIQDVVATGQVDGGGAAVVGGLLGRLASGTLDNGVARGPVTGGHTVGGLVGENTGVITNSHAEGTVTATDPGVNGAQAGGLVGRNDGGIVDSHSIGSVSSTTGSRVGGLAGYNSGELVDVHASVGSITGSSDVGGLVGYQDVAGSIADSDATGNVTATASNAGGLVGDNRGGITDSHATGNVSGGSNTGGLIGSNSAVLSGVHAGGVVNGVTNTGGLIGDNTGTVSDAHATGNVAGTGVTGGLIGLTAGSVSDAFATGNVSGVSTTGGLIGDVVGPATVSDSYATGAVSGTGGTGGLIGRVGSGAVVTRVYATGAVSGDSVAGGLIGINDGTIQDAYATGAVSAIGTNPRVGGVVGRNEDNGIVQRVYAAAPISNGASTLADNTTGGLIGDNVAGGVLLDSYWDAGARLDQRFDIGGTTLTAGRLGDVPAKTQSSYAGWDFAGTWIIYDGFTHPLLRTFMTPLTVTANNAAKTYDGAAFSGGNGVTYSATPNADLLGTLGYAGTSQGARNAGTYNIRAAGLYSHQQGYAIAFVDGTLTVAQAALSLSTSDVTKNYDGNTSGSGALTVVGGQLFGTDSLGGATFTFDTKNAGIGNKRVSVGGATVNDGNSGGNYAITYVDNTTSTINRATVTASGITASDKVYDGTVTATIDTSVASALSGVIGLDDVSLPVSGLSGEFLNKHVGSNKTVVLSGVALAGSDAGNYQLASVAPVTASITPAGITISTSDVTKTYDGTTAAAGTAIVSGGALYGTDGLAGGAFAFDTRHAGIGNKVVTVTGVTVNDGNSGNNYSVTYADNTTSTINRANLVLGTSDVTKTYDGNTSAAGAAVVTGGAQLFSTDSVSGGSFVFDSKNAGSGNKRVTVSGVTVADGNSGNNYNVSYVDNTTSTITPKALTVSGITAASRVYDQTDLAAVDFSAAVYAGLISGDAVALGGVTGTFADKNVGTGKTVTLASGYTGADVGNYAITSQATATADITPRALTMSGLVANNKVYDGTTSATVNVSGASYAGLLAGDAVTHSATGAFADRNVGNGKAVTLSSTYNGADVGNYSITSQTASTADITPAALSIRASDITKTVATTYTFAGTEFTATGLAVGETIGGVLLSSPGAVASATIAGGPYATTASGATGGSFSLANYNVTYLDGSMTLVAAPPASFVAPVNANPAAMQAAIIEAQKIDPQRSAPAEGGRGLNVIFIGAGINLPQGVE